MTNRPDEHERTRSLMRFNSQFAHFIRELKRRSVFQVGSIYLVTAWGASLGAAELFPAFGISAWGVRLFVVAAALGFPIVVALAWIFDLSSSGVSVDDSSDGAKARRNATTVLAEGNNWVRVTRRAADDRQESTATYANNFVIGRDEACELRLDDLMVSRRHTRIFVEGGCWYIEDLGSRNGTQVDGNQITRALLPARCTVMLYPDAPPLLIEIGADSNGHS